MNKNLIIIISIGILAIAGILAYAYLPKELVNDTQVVVNHDKQNTDNQPTNNTNQEPEVITSDIDTSDWQTYRNEELGFEFRYPEEWTKEDAGLGIVFTIPNNSNIPMLNNLGKIKLYSSDKLISDLLIEERNRLLKPWLDELGAEREILEEEIKKDRKKIFVLGPFSPPSNMYSDISIFVLNDDSIIILLANIIGGDIKFISKQIEGIYNSIVFF